jgi:hypothetical protein
MDEIKIFETRDVDLATFLVLEGVKLIECRKSDTRNKIVVMRFLDESQNCLDLERVYLNSDYKKFRDINKYLLKKIHETLRES